MKKTMILLLLASMTVLTACDYGSDLAVGGSDGTTLGSTSAQTAETTMWHCGLPEADPTEPSVSYALPPVGCIPIGEKITGKMPGTEVYLREMDGERIYDFTIRTVVHAEVIEVLPDSYYIPSCDTRYFVAKLRILDEIRGEKMPEEIYFRYFGYGRDVFDPYDSLILSIEQIGVENYLLINDTQGKYEYFPHMFQAAGGGDIGLGSVIAFSNGVVVDGYQFNYAADPGESFETVKERILAVAQGALEDSRYYGFWLDLPCDYLTGEDIFDTEEAKQVQAEVEPDGTNAYIQDVSVSYRSYDWDETIYADLNVTYTRVINGFSADERISVSRVLGEGTFVERFIPYDSDDLASVPDLAAALLQIDAAEVLLSDVSPSEKEIYLGWQFRATGYFRKANGEIYGVVNVMWDGSSGCIPQYEQFYLLYDSDGNGRVVDSKQLRELFWW